MFLPFSFLDFQQDPERLATLSDARQFAVSYSGLVIQMPDMFATESSASGTTILTDRLLGDRVRPEFLQALVERFKDDGLDAVSTSSLFFNNLRRNRTNKPNQLDFQSGAHLDLKQHEAAVVFKGLQSPHPSLDSTARFQAGGRFGALPAFVVPKELHGKRVRAHFLSGALFQAFGVLRG